MRGSALAVLIVLSLIPAAAGALAGERLQQLYDTAVRESRVKGLAAPVTAGSRPGVGNPLDRVAQAVDGAESSHGQDIAMWRPDSAGPQGPMQVSEAAATDVGGGDRFDVVQNRAIGRAYLAQLYWRYKSWPDAIAAYNWGIGNLDAWVKAGRPPDKFLIGVAAYTQRVLHDSGLCNGPAAPSDQRPRLRTQSPLQKSDGAVDQASQEACASFENWGAVFDGTGLQPSGFPRNRFYFRLERAMEVAMRHLSQPARRARASDDLAAGSWYAASQRP
jgi:Transglycosylase SLT domain